MTDDIVERLRAATQIYENQWHEECREAAEEIETLRVLLGDLVEAFRQVLDHPGAHIPVVRHLPLIRAMEALDD